MTQLRDVVARALFGHFYRKREWSSAKAWLKNTLYQKADTALVREGIDGTTEIRATGRGKDEVKR